MVFSAERLIDDFIANYFSGCLQLNVTISEKIVRFFGRLVYITAKLHNNNSNERFKILIIRRQDEGIPAVQCVFGLLNDQCLLRKVCYIK